MSCAQRALAVGLLFGLACTGGGGGGGGDGTTAPPPAVGPASGTYDSGQVITITAPSATSTVYYTTDGTTPSNTSSVLSPNFTGGSQTVTLLASATVKAYAVTSGAKSATVSVSYLIRPPTQPPQPSFPSGFTAGSVQINGDAVLNGTRLQLTGLVPGQVSSFFFVPQLSVTSFTTDFTFQFSRAGTAQFADGITFTLQNAGPFALGSRGGGLGYGADPLLDGYISSIHPSVAVKFDCYDDVGEGSDSTGVYTGGASPTLPADGLLASGIDLHSGDVFAVHLAYASGNLSVTITDESSTTIPKPSFTKAYPIDIPAAVGGPTAYVGFTGSTGGGTAVQDVLTWTYSTP